MTRLGRSGHGMVGEQGGVVKRGGIEYARVGGGDDGGAGGKRGLGHVLCGMAEC